MAARSVIRVTLGKIRDGSVNRENYDNAAYLNRNDGQLKLNWNYDDNANENYGSSSRRVFLAKPRFMRGF